MNQQAERIGILGGTFNPVHHGHLIVAREAREALELDRLLLLPNARSPLRRDEALAPAESRLEMVRRAVAGEPGLEACDLEVRREGVSYLVDTLRELRELHPDATLVFLMGADSLDTFDRWRDANEIVRLAEVRVLPRPGGTGDGMEALFSRAPDLRGLLDWAPGGSRIEISATDIRRRVAEGRSIRFLVPEAVEMLIRERGLYVDTEDPQTS